MFPKSMNRNLLDSCQKGLFYIPTLRFPVCSLGPGFCAIFANLLIGMAESRLLTRSISSMSSGITSLHVLKDATLFSLVL